MKGDFSRLPIDDARRNSGVWMQQGRVQLDSDWNEQVALSAERARAVARDAMGGSGAPVRDPGFQISLRSALRFNGKRTAAVVWKAEGPGFDPAAPFTLELRVAARAGSAGTLLDSAGRYALALAADGGITFRLGGRRPRRGQDAHPHASTPQPPAGAGDGPYASEHAAPDPVEGGTEEGGTEEGGTVQTAPRALASHRPAWVTAVFDGRAGYVYVDGVLAASGPMHPAHAWPWDEAPLTLGAALRDGVPRAALDGVLLEGRVWGRAHTLAEVRAGTARPPAHGAPGLAAWWRMDEAAGSWARDSSSNGFDAELGGAGTDAPRWMEPSLFIGAGRYWVEGVGCENDHEIPWSAQPYLPGARAPRGPADVLVYLEVWDRYLSAAEDPSLREVALAGGDTTGRTRPVWQVRAVELHGTSGRSGREEDDAARAGGGDEPVERGAGEHPGAHWERHLPASAGEGRMAARGSGATDNRLYRVEVRGEGGGYGWPRPAAAAAGAARVASIDPTSGVVRLAGDSSDADGWRAGQRVELYSARTDAARTAGTLHRVVRVAAAEEHGGPGLLLDPPAPPGVLADHPRVRRVATFVWSADNGSAAWAVQALDAATATAVLDDGGRSGLLPAEGDWVEVTDDVHALRGIPGPLCRVRALDAATLTVTLDPAPAGVSGEARHHPVLRRWDPAPGPDAAAEVPVHLGEWTALDATAAVRFDAGDLRTGDWWTIPVREGAPGGIEWPRGQGGPVAQPPQGITRHAAPLALVRHRGGRARVHDLRQVLTPAHGGDFVRRAGPEWMSGPLRIHGDLKVGGTLDAHLPPESVGEEQLARGAVTRSRLAEHAVAEHELAPHAVTTSRIRHGAVTTGTLADGAVTWRTLSDEVRTAIEGSDDPGRHGHHGHHEHHGHPCHHCHHEHDGHDGHHGHNGHHGHHGHHGEPHGVAGAVLFSREPVPPRGYVALEAALAVPPLVPTWRSVAALPLEDPAGVVCAALDGMVYVVSGSGKEFWRWSPSDDGWEPLAAPQPRAGSALCAAGGRVYLLGGMDERGNPDATVQAFDPGAGTWTAAAPLPTARAWLGAAELEGRIYAVGGRGERMVFSHASAAVEAYDPATGRWERRRGMYLRRVHAGVAAAAGEVYVVGGASRVHLGAGLTATSESYDPDTDRWTRRPRVTEPRGHLAAAAVHDSVYVAGGTQEEASAVSQVERFDPPARAWARFPRLPVALSGPTTAAVDGVLYVLGGVDARGTVSTTVFGCRTLTTLYAYEREEGAEAQV